MSLPSYFATTTLRSLAAQTGTPADDIVTLAKRAHLELHIGPGASALLSGTIFIELAARTFGSLSVHAEVETSRTLETQAQLINPRLELKARPSSRVVSVALGSDRDAQIRYSSRGWWFGPSPQSDVPSSSSMMPMGAIAAGAVAFNECYRTIFRSILQLGRTVDVVGWSLRDWSVRSPDADDEMPIPVLPLGEAALVGCGAIGQAVAFIISYLPRVDGVLDLVDPQTLSTSNLQRYVGSTPSDAIRAIHKVLLAHRHLPSVPGLALRRWAGDDWASYRSKEVNTPPLIITALDTAEDRRIVQAALPRWIVNGWTRTSACGGALHDFAGANQCLTCTYLPRDPMGATSDLALLANGLGLPPLRVTYLLAGASLQRSDLRAVGRHHGLPPGSLDRWRGESVRSLFGQICGMGDVRPELRDHYVVPSPQASVMAAVIAVAQIIKLKVGLPVTTQSVEVSLRDGPGLFWEQPPARKVDHPAPCICKDPDYLAAFAARWRAAT